MLLYKKAGLTTRDVRNSEYCKQLVQRTNHNVLKIRNYFCVNQELQHTKCIIKNGEHSV